VALEAFLRLSRARALSPLDILSIEIVDILTNYAMDRKTLFSVLA
jgi:hypothetical protein